MKRSAKFLSVLLVVALCVGFVPSAYALNNAVIGGPELGMFEESYGVTTVPSPTPSADPSTSPAPEDPAPSEALEGDVVVTEEPKDKNAEQPKEIEVSTAAELRQALKDIAYKGTITVTADIEDLTAPLEIGKSMNIDLMEHTLFFVPAGDVQSCAIYVAEGVESVNIGNGQMEIAADTDEDENVFGFTSAIISNADRLCLTWLDIRGALADGPMIVNENEDGSVIVEFGTFMSDPSAFVDGEEYNVEKTEDGWVVNAIEKEEPPVEPTDEPKDEPKDKPADETPAEPVPSPETPAEPTPSETPDVPEGIPFDPDAAPQGEENDGYSDGLLSGDRVFELGLIAQIADTEKTLQLWAEKGNDAPVPFTNDIELTESLTVMKDLALNLDGKKLAGTGILVTNVAGLSLRDGTVEAKINNTGKLDLTGVTAQEVSSSGSVSLLPGTSVEKLTVSSGEAVVDAGHVDTLFIQSGSVSLTGTADVDSIVMTGGALNVLGADDVTVGDVSIEGDVEINIDSGTFQSMAFGTAAFMGIATASEPGIYVVSGTKVTGGKFMHDLDEVFIAEGYTQGPDNGIMLMSADGSSSMIDGETQSNAVLYFKGTDKDLKQPIFDLKITSVGAGEQGNLSKVTVTRDAAGAEAQPLTVSNDYEYTPNAQKTSGGRLKLLTGGTTLQSLTPGFYVLNVEFDEKPIKGDFAQTIFVFPEITTDAKYIIGSGSEVQLTIGTNGVDKPTLGLTFANDSKHQNNDDTKLEETDDYSWAGNKLTLNASTLKERAKTAGTYYLGLWYADGARIYVPITVHEAPSAVPSSQNWIYNSGNVTVTVYSAYNKATGVTGGNPGIAKEDYTISENGRTVTIKGDYLKRLVNTETGAGHGLQEFTIQTEDGPVNIIIYIRPAIWARNNENTHRKGSDADLIFDCSAPLDPNCAPYLGSKSISAEDADGYKIEGNTITLKAAFLNKRNSQDWSLGVTTNAASGSMLIYTNFKVTGTSSGGTGVATGDENNAVVWTVVLVLSGAAVVALIPKKKKQDD